MIIIIFFAGLSNFFKSHWPAFVGAFVCGILFVLPQFMLRWNLGPEYKGMILGGIDGEFYYMRIQEVYDGNLKLASPGMFEYKDLPYTNSPLGELTAAGLGKLTGVQAPGVIVVGDFVFPILLFLVFYFLFWCLTGEKLLSFAAAAGILLASNFLLVPRNVLDLFLSSQGIVVNLYNRPIHPQVSSLYFFGWLLMFWLFLKNRVGTRHGASLHNDETKRWSLIISGVLFGLLFYVYPYSWMLAMVIQGLIATYILWKRNWQQLKRLLASFAVGLIVAIPYWLNFVELTKHPWYDTLKKFQGFYNTHEPVVSLLLVVDVFIIIVLWLWKKLQVRRLRVETQDFVSLQKVLMFACVFSVSAIILLNQQVITGIRFFPGHWHWYYVVPFSIFLVLFAGWRFLEKWPKVRVWFFGVVIVVFFVNGIVSQKNYYRDASPSAIESQQLAPVYDWLNRNTPKHSVVLADPSLTQWISFYTHNNHYLSTYFDTLSLIPEERVRHDFFVKKYLGGAREDNVDEFINQQTPEFHYVLFGYWRRYEFGCSECFPGEEIQKIRQEYLEFLKHNIYDEIKKYQVDYLVLDQVKGKWNVEELDFLEEEARVGEFVIYKVSS